MSSARDLRRKALRAFVMVTVKPGTSEEIVRSRRIKGVRMANSVLGRFDAVVVIEAESLEELRKIIYEMVDFGGYTLKELAEDVAPPPKELNR